MMQQLLTAGLGTAVDKVLGRFFEDKDKAAAAAQELRLAMMEHEQTAQQVARDVVVAEAKSEHWITSAWRPITMLTFVVMIGNNYILAPYLDAILGTSIMFDLPDQAWSLLSVGLGGYVVGRSGEKIASELRNKGTE
ncbi:MAG TPA: 3TM-type holin [Candidatus Paceibacterota bacterium]|nr:3TM-type holin [Candidatus Paceibacterota bacterium]